MLSHDYTTHLQCRQQQVLHLVSKTTQVSPDIHTLKKHSYKYNSYKYKHHHYIRMHYK